jgi:hypothetical protein
MLLACTLVQADARGGLPALALSSQSWPSRLGPMISGWPGADCWGCSRNRASASFHSSPLPGGSIARVLPNGAAMAVPSTDTCCGLAAMAVPSTDTCCGLAAVVNILSLLCDTPVLMWGASASSLSDRGTYPTLSRTAIRDAVLAESVIWGISSMGWTWIAILHVNDVWGKCCSP